MDGQSIIPLLKINLADLHLQLDSHSDSGKWIQRIPVLF